MVVRSPEEIFRSQVHSGLVARDIDAFVSHFSTDCVVRVMAEPEARVGRDAVREWASAYAEMMTDTEVEYGTIFSDGAYLLGEFVVRGRYQGDGADPGGTPVVLHYCVVDAIRDGLVRRETVYGDPHELERQLSTKDRPRS